MFKSEICIYKAAGQTCDDSHRCLLVSQEVAGVFAGLAAETKTLLKKNLQATTLEECSQELIRLHESEGKGLAAEARYLRAQLTAMTKDRDQYVAKDQEAEHRVQANKALKGSWSKAYSDLDTTREQLETFYEGLSFVEKGRFRLSFGGKPSGMLVCQLMEALKKTKVTT